MRQYNVLSGFALLPIAELASLRKDALDLTVLRIALDRVREGSPQLYAVLAGQLEAVEEEVPF